MILTSPRAYEPEPTDALKTWYTKVGKSIYTCGPLFPTASKVAAAANELKQATHGAEIQDFLGNALKTSGEKSVLYVGA